MAMLDGDIVKWLKAEGDRVIQGEPLVEVETAKASACVEAPVSGKLVRVLVREGDTAEVAQVLAEIEPE